MRRFLALAAPLAVAAFIGCSSDDEPVIAQTPAADAGGVDSGPSTRADSGVDANAPGPTIDAAPPIAIGVTGGAVESDDGRAQLVVPPLAFEKDLAIVVAPSTRPVDATIVSKAYEISPNDTTFTRDLDLCIETSSSVATKDVCLAYFDEKSTKWTCEDTCLSRKKGTNHLCGHTNHFTSFAILLSGSTATEEGACGSDLVAPTGGSVVGPKGDAVVSFPSGGLTKPTRVSVTKIPAPAPSDFGSSVFELRANDTTSFGGDVEVCLRAAAGKPVTGACLGYFDEKNKQWKCEDRCLTAKKGGGSDGLYCGNTDHFTNFAILLSGSSDATVASASCIEGLVPTSGATLVSLDSVATYAVADGGFTKPTRVTLARAPSEKGLASDVFQVLGNDTLAKPSTVCLTPNPGASLDKGCLATRNAAGGWTCVTPCLQQSGARACAATSTFGFFALLSDGGTGFTCVK